MILIRKIRLIWGSLLGLLIVSLLYLAIVPFGVISYTTDFLKYNYFISEFSPKERLQGEVSTAKRKLIGEPVYFFVRPPRPFQTASLTLTYTNPAAFMEIGICRDKTTWGFERQPLYFEKLEELARTDNVVKENDVMLWQKEKKYHSMADFFKNLPSAQKVAVYNYNVAFPFSFLDYKALAEEKAYEVGARGSYVLLTYSNGEPIDILLDLKNDSMEKNNQPIVLQLYNSTGEIILTENFNFSSLESEKDPSLQKRLITKSLEPGYYRFEFKASDDIITHSLTTKQSRIAFVNRLWLTDAKRSHFSLFTDSTNIQAQTLNPKSLQKIMINNESFDIKETYQQFSITLSDQTRVTKEVTLEHDDLIIAGDGVFSLEASHIINPLPRSFSDKSQLENSDIEYVLARYQPVGTTDPLQRTIVFDVSPTCLDRRGIPFMIAAPGLNENDPVEIKFLTIKFVGATLLDYVSKLWN